MKIFPEHDPTLATNLARLIHSELENCPRIQTDRYPNTSYLEGVLNLSHGGIQIDQCADLKISIPHDWIDTLPRIICTSPWTMWRPGGNPDWHIYGDRSLCWVLDTEWTFNLNRFFSKFSADATVEVAGYWCLNNVRWLLWRHYLSFTMGESNWKKHDWDAWPHRRIDFDEFVTLSKARR